MLLGPGHAWAKTELNPNIMPPKHWNQNNSTDQIFLKRNNRQDYFKLILDLLSIWLAKSMSFLSRKLLILGVCEAGISYKDLILNFQMPRVCQKCDIKP